MSRKPPTPKEEADRTIARGRELLERGDLPAATEALNRAVRLYWAAGEQYSAAAQIGNYGWALRRKGRADLARPYLAEAARLFGEMGLAELAERHAAAAADVAAELTPEFLASLPPAVRGALERGDQAGLQFALDSLELAERELLVERLVAVGVISDPQGDDGVGQALAQFAPLLEAIAAVARGAEAERPDVEAALADLERKGWRLRRPAEKIWAGERRDGPLTQGLDEVDAALVRRVLELIASP